jgi:hypothetical protein
MLPKRRTCPDENSRGVKPSHDANLPGSPKGVDVTDRSGKCRGGDQPDTRDLLQSLADLRVTSNGSELHVNLAQTFPNRTNLIHDPLQHRPDDRGYLRRVARYMLEHSQRYVLQAMR